MNIYDNFFKKNRSYSAGFSKEAKIKATIATISFLTIGIVNFLFTSLGPEKIGNALPIFICYVILIWNTFYSIRCYSTIIPDGRKEQYFLDTILVILYFVLAMSFSNIILFIFISCLFFSISVMKYVLLLNITNHNRLFKRKSYMNGLGTIICLLAFGAILMDYQSITLWLLVAIYFTASIYFYFPVIIFYSLKRTYIN